MVSKKKGRSGELMRRARSNKTRLPRKINKVKDKKLKSREQTQSKRRSQNQNIKGTRAIFSPDQDIKRIALALAPNPNRKPNRTRAILAPNRVERKPSGFLQKEKEKVQMRR